MTYLTGKGQSQCPVVWVLSSFLLGHHRERTYPTFVAILRYYTIALGVWVYTTPPPVGFMGIQILQVLWLHLWVSKYCRFYGYTNLTFFLYVCMYQMLQVLWLH
jgi:hypothetical protein